MYPNASLCMLAARLLQLLLLPAVCNLLQYVAACLYLAAPTGACN